MSAAMGEEPGVLDVALWLAARGWYVFPVDHPSLPRCAGVPPRDHETCTKRGKHPAASWKREATRDPQIITAMFAGAARNIGVACGASGLLVIDEDVPGEYARWLTEAGLAYEPTLTVGTGAGVHYFYDATECGDLGNGEAPFKGYGINVRGAGGYVVTHGSLHASGRRYVADWAALAKPPMQLVEALRSRCSGAVATYPTFQQPSSSGLYEVPERIPVGKRHAAMVSYAGHLHAKGVPYQDARRAFVSVLRENCERQPTEGDAWELHAVSSILEDVYRRYEPGTPRRREPGEPLPSEVLPGGRSVSITWAKDIAPELVRWMWESRVSIGSLTLLAGREGQGKSNVTVSLAAAVSRGLLPGEFYGRPRSVIVCAPEDVWRFTVVPRLMAAGADMARVGRIDVSDDTGSGFRLVVPLDVDALAAVIRTEDVALTVLDPVISLLSSGTSTSRDTELRSALQPIADLAEQTDTAVLGIVHMNKARDVDFSTQIAGSRAWSQVARHVLGVKPDPDEPGGEVQILFNGKNNLGPLASTLRYRNAPAQVQFPDGNCAATVCVQWLGESPITGREAAEAEPTDAPAVADAKTWLEGYLQLNPDSIAGHVKRAASAAGHSQRTVERASNALGVIVHRKGYPVVVTWSLPIAIGVTP